MLLWQTQQQAYSADTAMTLNLLFEPCQFNDANHHYVLRYITALSLRFNRVKSIFIQTISEMRMFSIEGKEDSPSVLIDEGRNLLEISGNSTLKDTHWFYGNVLKWMIAFNSGVGKTSTVNIRLKRINESSLRWIALILQKVSLNVPASSLEINWYIDGKSPRLLASGQMLQSQTTYRVNFVSHQGDC